MAKKIDYSKFENFSITPRLVRLTEGEDGDTMWLTSPDKSMDCCYIGYRIQNIAQDGGFEFKAWSMFDGHEITQIPFEDRFNLDKVKHFLAVHCGDITHQIEQQKIADAKREEERKAKALAQKVKNEEKYYGWSSTTYYKVKRIVAIKDNPKLTEQFVAVVLSNCCSGGNCEERAYMLLRLYKIGLINMTNLNRLVKI